MQQVTLITGGSGDIGSAVAIRMAVDSPVLLVARNEGNLKQVCIEIEEDYGAHAEYVVGDVCDPKTIKLVFEKLKKLGWVVRNLVCAAGVASNGPISDIKEEDWHEMFNVNVHGTYAFIKAFLPEMVERNQGSISIISSIAGIKGFKNDSGYSATKHALNGIAESVSAEVRKHNIPVVAICPGYVRGHLTNKTVEKIMKYKGLGWTQSEIYVGNLNPQKRIINTWEVAEAVAFVASSAGMSVSGKPMTLHRETDARILRLVNWVTDKAKNAEKLLVPVSGGSDSALVLKLCSMAYPDKTLGIYYGHRSALREATYLESLAPICYAPAFEGDEIDRWAALLKYSRDTGGWIVGSRNRTEEEMGTYSMASRVVGLLPLVRTWKSEVMEFCEGLGIPSSIMESSRRADPDCGRPEELAEIPLETIDTYLQGSKLSSDKQMEYLDSVIKYNSFKKDLPNKGPASDL